MRSRARCCCSQDHRRKANTPDGGANRHEASFNCAKASTRIEKLICSDPEVSDLDGELASAYRRSLTSASEPDALKAEQRTWLTTERSKCWNVPCLRQTYQKRIAILTTSQAGERAALSTPPAPKQVPFGTAVCDAVRNEIARGWPMFHKKGEGSALSRIDWRPVDAARSLPPELQEDAEESRFDFDNDGIGDRVFSVEFDNHYMQGSVLLIERGPELRDRWFIPVSSTQRRS